MATYYRIDEWNKQGNGSNIRFEESKSEAMSWVAGMNQISAAETDGIEHTSIHEFEADSCDMNGWNNSNADQTSPIHFA